MSAAPIASRLAAPPRVLVTRPAAEAKAWVTGLRALGIDALAFPLIEILPVADPGPVRAAWRAFDRYAAVMFVSPSAVAGFFDKKTALSSVNWSLDAIKTKAWSPGPGTSRALRAAGWPAACIDAPALESAQFDSEALWARVGPQVRAGQHVLIVRGGDAAGRGAGRDWLAARLAAAGAVVEEVVAYRRRAPVLDEARQALAHQAAADGSVWLFSSSEAVRTLVGQLGGQDLRATRALATHPRIAEAARRAGLGVVWESRPTVDAVAASIKSIR